MMKHGCGLTLRAPMYLNCLEQQNEFELDARSAKRAFEVSGVLHARLVLRGAAVASARYICPKVLFCESDSARGVRSFARDKESKGKLLMTLA